MLAASEDMLDVIDGPYEVYNFGGKDNTFESRVLDSAPVEVRRNVITTAAITFDKLTRIVEKSDTGLEQAAGVLDQIADGLRRSRSGTGLRPPPMRLDELERLVSRAQLLSLVDAARFKLALWFGAVSSGKTVISLWAFLLAMRVAPKTGSS